MNIKITCKYPEHTVTTPIGSEEHKFDKAILKGILENHGCTDVKIEDISIRTSAQNRGLHVYYTEWAEKLNEAGWDMKKTLKKNIDIPWDKNMFKKYIWKPIQEAKFGKKSTTELKKTGEIDEIFDIINRGLGGKTGIYVPFPSQQEKNLKDK